MASVRILVGISTLGFVYREYRYTHTGVFDFDRGNSARLLAILFAGVTAVFIAVYYLIAGWKKWKGVSISS